jgi:hypothetical protein
LARVTSTLDEAQRSGERQMVSEKGGAFFDSGDFPQKMVCPWAIKKLHAQDVNHDFRLF